MLRPLLKASVIALALAVTSAASAQDVHLRFGLADDADALDPHLNRTSAAETILNALCDRLIYLDRNMQFQPGLATEWIWSDNGRTLTLTIRNGVVFHDGPGQCEAVKYNIDRAINLPGWGDRRSDGDRQHRGEREQSRNPSEGGQCSAAGQVRRADRLDYFAQGRGSGAHEFWTKPVCSGLQVRRRWPRDRVVVDGFPTLGTRPNTSSTASRSGLFRTTR